MADLIPRFRDPGWIRPPDPSTDTSLSTVDLLNQINRGAQSAANVARIPGAAGLEPQSSVDIAGLLNPPAVFPDINRQAAELGSARGVPGSPAAFGTGLRMTEDERLKHIALGTQLLNAAYGRNPGAPLINPAIYTITPFQRQELANQSLAGFGRGGGGSFSPRYGGEAPQRYMDLSRLIGGGANAADPYSFPSTGAGGGFDLDTTLHELGLADLPGMEEGSDYTVPGFDQPPSDFYE